MSLSYRSGPASAQGPAVLFLTPPVTTQRTRLRFLVESTAAENWAAVGTAFAELLRTQSVLQLGWLSIDGPLSGFRRPASIQPPGQRSAAPPPAGRRSRLFADRVSGSPDCRPSPGH